MVASGAADRGCSGQVRLPWAKEWQTISFGVTRITEADGPGRKCKSQQGYLVVPKDKPKGGVQNRLQPPLS